MKYLLNLLLLIIAQQSVFCQITASPCSEASIIQRQLESNPNYGHEIAKTEIALQEIIKDIRRGTMEHSRVNATYTIPVVMHVFHVGDDGKMDLEQALSGLELLNQDFNGLNDGWDSIDDNFDAIKGTLDINFCLATIDPEGNPTTGIVYHEDEQAMLNQIDLFQYAWDNYKYLNIYFPKYTGGAPSDFTAYAYYPNTFNTQNNRDGIFYSSIRWGFGNHSILDEGDDWASVCSHEAGHWLDLRHTFENGCSSQGDFVDDTPPTLGGTIELEGCYNNDMSCGEATNGSNFMDYNHRCKKMFTLGQVERMEAALFLPSRINLWTEENLISTGCLEIDTALDDLALNKQFLVYPNPAKNYITIKGESGNELTIFHTNGQIRETYVLQESENLIDVSQYNDGLYFYAISTENKSETGKFIINK